MRTDPESGRRALRRRLALDPAPLRSTLAKGLGQPVTEEAAAFCAAVVEALCELLFAAALDLFRGQEPRLSVLHLQLALRGHSILSGLLPRVDGVALVLEFFLDDATSRELHERRLLASRDAPHLKKVAAANADEDEERLIQRHARTRSEWARRADDPFAESEFAAVLKGAHPAFSLSYNATAMLSAVVRELLNAVCDRLPIASSPLAAVDVRMAIMTVLGPDDPLAQHMIRVGSHCVDLLRTVGDASLPSTATTTTLRFRVVHPGSAAALTSPLAHTLPNVPIFAAFAQLLPLMCKRGHIADANGWLAVYRGREVDARATPSTLGIPDQSSKSEPASELFVEATLAGDNMPLMFVVSRRWWDDVRRNDARRGRLASQRPQDARVRSIAAAAESKVRQDLRRSRSRSPSPPPQSIHSRSVAALSTLRTSPSKPTTLGTAQSTTSLPSDDHDSLARLLDVVGHRSKKKTADKDRDQDEVATTTRRLCADLVAALRSAVKDAETAATARPGGPASDPVAEWAGRVRSLDAVAARATAARAAAAQMLARVADATEDGP